MRMERKVRNMLIEILPKAALPSFMEYLEGKSSLRIQEYIKRQLEEDKAGEQLTIGFCLFMKSPWLCR